MKLRPKCTNCDKSADYNLHGSWVCKICYPFDAWNNPSSAAVRETRRKAALARQAGVNRNPFRR